MPDGQPGCTSNRDADERPNADASVLPNGSDWRPACSMQALQVRAAMLRTIRQFFQHHEYLEVETPLLSQDVVVDAHLHPFIVPSATGPRYLQTSPEAGMKRLLAAGSGSIYQITRSFRRDECGFRHNPEFTMLEWYGIGTDHWQQMELTESLVRACATAAAIQMERPVPSWCGPQPFGRISYDQAFVRALGEPVLGRSAEDLLKLCRRFGTPLPDSVDRNGTDDLLNLLLAVHVEPTLGRGIPEFVYGYPASQAALARIGSDDTRTADRFELYADGMELCNGYHELTDPDELRQRDATNNESRVRQQESQLPGAFRMLQAMQAGLPACSGVALGFDRLVMLAMQAASIDEVLPFPFHRA